MPSSEQPHDTRLSELLEKWRAEGARIDTFHATMGIGYKVCADELAAVLLGGTPQPQELCDVCERPLGPADTICCSHCGTKWAEPFPGRAASGGAASSPTQISNRCPACGNQTLFIAEGGWLTCSWLTCPNPCALREIADGYRREITSAASGGSALTSAALPHDVDSLTKRGHMLIDSWPTEWQRAFWRNLLVAGGTTISPTPEQEVPVENRDLYGSCRACQTATWCWLFQTCLTRAAPIGAFQGRAAAPVRPVQETP